MLSLNLNHSTSGDGMQLTSPERVYQAVSIAVFAYNEQAAISDTIASAVAAAECAFDRDQIQIHVLANGCTDKTVDIVGHLSELDSRITLHNISQGDKAATWNHYVHEIADLSCMRLLHVFMDGDVGATERVLVNVVESLTASPEAPACSVLPAVGFGRSRDLNIQLYEQDGALFGNLYALTTAFLIRVREARIRLPIGAVGDDALVTEMVALDLDRGNQYDNRKAVRAADPEGFTYQPLSPFRPADIHLYLHRRIRYQIRTWQLKLCQQLNFDQLPNHIQELDQQILERLGNGILWNPIHFLARRRIQKRGTNSYSKS